MFNVVMRSNDAYVYGLCLDIMIGIMDDYALDVMMSQSLIS